MYKVALIRSAIFCFYNTILTTYVSVEDSISAYTLKPSRSTLLSKISYPPVTPSSPLCNSPLARTSTGP